MMTDDDFLTTVTMYGIDVAAKTVWGEARGEGFKGQVAVAWVIRNRVAKQSWYGSGVVDVCKYPKQFSCWNDDDPNRVLCAAVSWTDAVFRECVAAVVSVFDGGVDDPTKGSTHYHHRDAAPPWAAGHDPVAEIGKHVFYAGIA